MDIETPKDIQFDTMVVDLCFHPQKDVIAAGDIDGDVTVYSYSTSEDNHLLLTLPHHKKSCRTLRFSPSGEKLITASKDKSIQVVDMDTGTVKTKIKKAHEVPLYSLLVVDENIVASGDDDGHFKVWDMRLSKSVMEAKENDEFISDMVIDKNNRILVASSGDGTLSAFDIRKHKLKIQSELFDSELLSLAKVKDGEKVVCGTGEGAVNIFNWGEWGNISDRFPGHPMSVDCIVPINKNIVVTGSIDGIVRAVNILPNRFLGVVGEHKGFPVENMSKSRCNNLIATCSHDQLIKFWNIEDIVKEKINIKKKAKKSTQFKPLSKWAKKNDFFSDLADGEGTSKDDKDENDSDESGEDASDDNDEGDTTKQTETSPSKENALGTDKKGDMNDYDNGGAETSDIESEVNSDVIQVNDDDQLLEDSSSDDTDDESDEGT